MDETSRGCVRHPMAVAEEICGECGYQFCPECVVFPFGAHRPPVCISCALELGGVRSQSRKRPKLSKKTVKQRLRMQAALNDVEARKEADIVARAAAENAAASEFSWLEPHDAENLPGGWQASYD